MTGVTELWQLKYVTFAVEIQTSMENVAGYLATGLIGVSLGLIGGGGSIITIPVLVYLFHIEPTIATLYSLFIVGTTSLVGGIRSAVNKMVDFRSAVLFAIPSTLAVYLTRHYLLPHIPDTLFVVASFIRNQEHRHHDILFNYNVIRFASDDT